MDNKHIYIAEYAPGKYLVVDDAMSRNPIKITPSSSVALEFELESSCTRDDSILKSAIIHTLTGWPKYEKDIPDNLRELFNVRSFLSVSNGFRT